MGSLRSLKRRADKSVPYEHSPRHVVTTQLVLDALGLTLGHHYSHIHHTFHIVQGTLRYFSYYTWRPLFPVLKCEALDKDLSEVRDYFGDKKEGQSLGIGLRLPVKQAIQKMKPLLITPGGTPLDDENWVRLVSVSWWWKRNPSVIKKGKSIESCIEESLGQHSWDAWHMDEAFAAIEWYKLDERNY